MPNETRQARNDRRTYQAIMIMLAMIIALTGGADIWEVATGQVKANQHLPFIYPVALSLIMGIVWFIERHCPLPPVRSRLRAD